MFGKCVTFCGVPRSYHIADEALLTPVHALLHPVLAGTRPPCVLKEHNLHLLACKPHLLSVSPAGRRCHLVLTRLGGVAVSLLCENRRDSPLRVITIPLRFDASVYERTPVFACTMNDATRTLLLDDLLSMDGYLLSRSDLHTRASALHDVVHNLYRPDVHLLPLKLETRRHFSFAQFTDALRFAEHLPYVASAMSVRPMWLQHRELLAPMKRAANRTGGSRPPPRSPSAPTDAKVVKGDSPDMYHVQHATHPGFLTVKTLRESQELARLFGSAACVTMRVVYSDSAWARVT
jgi:hypothetical protein